MAFKETDFMTPLKTFLESYPALQSWETLSIDYLDIDPRNPDRPQGAAVTVVGGTSSKTRDVTNNDIWNCQEDMMLSLRRYTNDNELRRDLGNFIINYKKWLRYEESMRGTSEENPLLPKFGDTAIETINCNGGTQTGVEIESGVDEYSLQVHITYQEIYDKPQEW